VRAAIGRTLRGVAKPRSTSLPVAAEEFFHARFRADEDHASATAQQAYTKTTLRFHGVDAKTECAARPRS